MTTSLPASGIVAMEVIHRRQLLALPCNDPRQCVGSGLLSQISNFSITEVYSDD